MKTLLPVLLTFLFIGCSSTNIVTMSVKQPAIVEIPQSFQHAGIVNRSRSTERNNVLERIDQVFSLEGQKLGREGALESIKGLREELERIDRFRRIIIADSDRLENPAYGVFPRPLSQESINEINGDVDIAIEYARIAYENYNISESLRYLNILRERQRSLEALSRQGINARR